MAAPPPAATPPPGPGSCIPRPGGALCRGPPFMVTTRHQRRDEISSRPARSRHRRGAAGAMTSRALVVSRLTRGRAPPIVTLPLADSTSSSRASASACRAALAHRQGCPQTCHARPLTKPRRHAPATSSTLRAALGAAAPLGAPLEVRAASRRRPARPLWRGARARRGRAALPALLLLLLLLLAMASRVRTSCAVGWSG